MPFESNVYGGSQSEPAAGAVYPASLQGGINGDISAAPPLEGFAYRVMGASLPDHSVIPPVWSRTSCA